MYLLDTDWTVDYVSGKRNASDLVYRFPREDMALSVITLGEVLEGILGKSLLERQRVIFENFVSSVAVLIVDARIAQEYARIRSQLRSTGNLIPDNDLWIAATAVAYDLVLVSRDAHFQRVPGLRVREGGTS